MKKDPWFRNRLIRDGILRAIEERMGVDPSVYIMGEGAHMKVHFDAPGIEEKYSDRVITLPISEDANTNFAVGMSLAGVTPIVDVITSDFLFRTMDSICNTVAKTNYVNEPRTLVIRAEFLTGGPTTGQRIESLFTHIPGLDVVVPSNPVDAYTSMRDALDKKTVTVFFEDRMIEDSTTPEDLKLGPAIDSKSSRTCVRKTGSKLTIVSYGLMLRRLQVLLDGRPDLDYELIDLCFLYPYDRRAVHDSVRKTGRMLVVEPDVVFNGVGSEIVADLVEHLPGALTKRVGSPRVTIPASRDLHPDLFPSEDRILEAALELVK